MPGWNRECPLGVPLPVYILTLAGPDSFLRALVSIGRGGLDLRDFGVYSFLLSSNSNSQDISFYKLEYWTTLDNMGCYKLMSKIGKKSWILPISLKI